MADLSPTQKQQLEGEIAQLRVEGYSREALVDYAKKFKADADGRPRSV